MTRKWLVLAAIGCGTFMATLDSSVINIALPTLTKTFNADLSSVKWVVIVYLLVITCLLLPMGRLSDQIGRKRIYISGFLVFSVASLACALSGSLGALIFWRGVQGIGASMLMANGPAIITASFPGSQRGTALGVISMAVSAGLVSGPSIGGFLVKSLGWPSIFLVQMPVALLGTFLALQYVLKDSRIKISSSFDWAGAIIQSFLIIFFILALDPPSFSVFGEYSFRVSRTLIGILGLVLLAIFLKIESQAKRPVFDFYLLKDRTFWTANLSAFFLFVSYASVFVLMPFFLEREMSYDTGRAGLFMTAIPLTIFVVAPLSGRLSDRFGSRGLSFIGAGVGSLGVLLMSGVIGKGLNHSINSWEIVLFLCLMGFALGLFQTPNNNAIMASVPKEKLGTASALIATIRNLGMVTGAGLATSLFTWRNNADGSFSGSFHFALGVAGVFGIIATVAALGKKSGPYPD